MALLGGRLRYPGIVAGALAALLPCMAAAEDESLPLEDAVKAAYVYKFAPFVTWPQGGSGPFAICSIGADRVTALLPQVTEGQRIGDRVLHVRALGEGELPSDCQVLYIAAPVPTAPILDSVRGKPILTITSGPGPHGVIHLVTVASHVRFDIDAKLAAEDGLTISSKLLSLARTVISAQGTPP